MCGRFLLESDIEDIIRTYSYIANSTRDVSLPKGEVFPSNLVPIITQEKELKLLKWGYTLRNSKSLIINARAENLMTKPSFKKSIVHRRCIIPANSFFEWKGEKGRKEKFIISLNHSKLFSMAGLYDIFTNDIGENFAAFVIITTEANKDMSSIHGRMPVILRREDELTWLSTNSTEIEGLMRPYKDGTLNIIPADGLIQTSLY